MDGEPDTREWLIVLRLLDDDPETDWLHYPYDEILAAPEGEGSRHVTVVSVTEVKR